MQLNIFAGPI